MTHLKKGDKAPHFEGIDQDGQPISLDDFKGKKLILYFYPKDNTSGCTTESCEFRDALPDFSAADAAIVGVSRDSVKSHQGFTEKQALNFPLIADTDELLCRAFDVIQIKKNYGKESLGVERSTFIIDPNGKLAHAWRKVRVKEHVADVLNTLKKLQG